MEWGGGGSRHWRGRWNRQPPRHSFAVLILGKFCEPRKGNRKLVLWKGQQTGLGDLPNPGSAMTC